jgi:hypothetical protein
MIKPPHRTKIEGVSFLETSVFTAGLGRDTPCFITAWAKFWMMALACGLAQTHMTSIE